MASALAAETEARAKASRQGSESPKSDITASTLRQHILQVLKERGGRAECREVLNRLAEVLAPRLGHNDREMANGRVRWEHAADT